MGSKRYIAVASVGATLVFGLSAGAAGAARCPNANTPAVSASLADMRAAVVCLVNQQRTSRGLPPLKVSPKLNTVAQRWTVHMVSHGEFSHANFTARVNAVHYPWRAAAENIATGYPTPSEVVAGWMASPGHCHNILDPSMREVGTGERPAPVRGFASRPATWTQDFGLQRSQTPPSQNFGSGHRCPY
jgi:uncharacterized protein YkwD